MSRKWRYGGVPDQTVLVTERLPLELERALLTLLWKYENVFAWSPSDLQGVSR
jgi:hypothetical protein